MHKTENDKPVEELKVIDSHDTTEETTSSDKQESSEKEDKPLDKTAIL